VNMTVVKTAPKTPLVSRARLKCWDMASSGARNGNRLTWRLVPATVHFRPG
jgi:hypothetical protein